MIKTHPQYRKAMLVLLALLGFVLTAPRVFAAEERTGKFWSDDRIYNDLFVAAIASELGKKCAGITVRSLRGFSHLSGLYSYARGIGHSHSEIRAFIDSASEKARLRGWSVAYLQEQGVIVDNLDSLCAYGLREIDNNSQIGTLLRKK